MLEVAEEMKANPASHSKEVTKLKKLSHQLTGMGGQGGGSSALLVRRDGRRASVAQGVACPPRLGAVWVAGAR